MLLKIKELAKRSGHSESYYYNGKSKGTLDLKFLKFGKSVRVRESDFEQWLHSHEEQ